MKLLFLNHEISDACSFYRSGGIAHNLAMQSRTEITVKNYTDSYDLGAYDVVMLHRPCTQRELDICMSAAELYLKIIIDHDDNILAVPEHHNLHYLYAGEERRNHIIECLKLADVVTVTNSTLKEVYSEYNDNVIVVPNAINPTREKREANKNNVIAWRGGDSHYKDIMSVSDALRTSTLRFRDWRFEYIGSKPVFLPKFTNVVFTEPMKVPEFMDYLYNLAPKIVQVPLVDDTFNRGKSQIAAMEATFVGAACLVPHWWDIPAIKYKTPADYASALNSMLIGEIDLEAYNETAWEYVCDNWLLDDVNKIRVEILKNL